MTIEGVKSVKAAMAVMAFAALMAIAAPPPPATSTAPQPENGIRKVVVPCSLCAKSSVGRGRRSYGLITVKGDEFQCVLKTV